MTPLPDLIASGFSFIFALTFIFWGLSIPIRWLVRHLSL
jgi:hypothetical protein